MSRIRVLDLAKELGIETRTAIVKLQELGIQVKNHFNALSETEAAKLRAYHHSGKNPDKESAHKPASKVIIRRRPEAHVEEGAFGSAAYDGNMASSTLDGIVNQTERDTHFSSTQTKEEELSDKHIPDQDAKSSYARTGSSHDVLKELQPHVDYSAEERTSFAVASTGQENHQNNKKMTTRHDDGLQPSSHPKPLTSPGPTSTSSTSQAVSSAQPRSLSTSQKDGSTPQKASSFSGAVVVRRAEPTNNASQLQRQPQSRAPYGNNSGSQGNQGQSQYSGQTRYGNGNIRNSDRSQGPDSGNYQQRGGDAAGYRRPQYGQDAGGRFGQQQNGSAPVARRPDGGTYNNQASGASSQGRYSSSYGQGQAPYGSGGGSGGRPYAPSAGGGYTGNRPQPSKPFVMPDTTLPSSGKESPVRVSRGEKEREYKRKTDEEEARAKHGMRLKGARPGESSLDSEYGDEIYSLDFDGDGGNAEEQRVRTVIPNRKKGSGRNKKDAFKKQPLANPRAASKKIIRVDGSMTVNDLAVELSRKAPAVIKTLMKLGMMASINQQLDYDTITFVAQEFGYETQDTSVSIGDILARKRAKIEENDLVSRPPIITIMGHVDHGKTSLLDAIRSANVASKEAGGITQHIGAYQIEYSGRKLTFLDTPGHEAFTSMRARGAQVTDIVVLVVAADDGVMPQTIEAIAHAKAAQVPIIVAINKIDKPGINVDRIMRELSEQGVLPEEWGGDSIFVQVSAKTQQGLDTLIESILLQSDVLDLKASQNGFAEGVVIEAKLDKARGALATIIVTKGILKQQDFIVVGRCYGRVRALFDDKGNKVLDAGPSTPVELIGLDGIPESGDTLNCVASDSIAKEAVAYRAEKQRQKGLTSSKGSSMDELLAMLATTSENKVKELPVIIKADTHGSTEAIRASLQKLDTAKVKTKIILAAVGGITETDVILASASKALIVGFNVRPDKNAAHESEMKGIHVLCFTIIYELIDAVQTAMVGTLAPIKQDKVLGHAEVRNTFMVPKVGVIAGSMISDGKVTRNSHIRILRDSTIIYTGRVASLKRFKEDTKEVLQGFECGISVENYNDIKIGDVLEAFVVEEVAATL